MATFLWLVFSSTGVLTAMAVSVAWLILRPSSRVARVCAVTVVVFYAAVSVFGVSYQGERLLARGFRPLTAADVPAGPTAIVVLGSGSFTARDWSRGEYTIVDGSASERVLEAVRVYRLIGGAWVISSGGSTQADNPNAPTGLAMKSALLQLGIPPDRILDETQSRNTSEEATILKPMLHGLGVANVVLVTSAAHMRRSVGTFRAAGIEVIPAIARNAYLDRPWREWWLPTDVGLWEGGAVAHELAGIVGYYARGLLAF